MNIIQSMINEKLGEVRIIRSEDGDVMNTKFCALDVCRALGYSEGSIRTVISRHCNAVTICNGVDSLGKSNSMNFILLPDVFRLVDRSNKPEAKEFQNWLYNEVLPSLYQFGTYTVENHINNPQMNNPIFDPESITELSLQEQNNHTTTISDYGNGMEFDNFNLTRDISIVIGQLLQPLVQNQQVIYDRLNNIESEVKEIKQMIIPATIISKEDK